MRACAGKEKTSKTKKVSENDSDSKTVVESGEIPAIEGVNVDGELFRTKSNITNIRYTVFQL